MAATKDLTASQLDAKIARAEELRDEALEAYREADRALTRRSSALNNLREERDRRIVTAGSLTMATLLDMGPNPHAETEAMYKAANAAIEDLSVQGAYRLSTSGYYPDTNQRAISLSVHPNTTEVQLDKLAKTLSEDLSAIKLTQPEVDHAPLEEKVRVIGLTDDDLSASGSLGLFMFEDGTAQVSKTTYGRTRLLDKRRPLRATLGYVRQYHSYS